VSAFYIQNNSTDPLGTDTSNNNNLDTRDEKVLDYRIGHKIGEKYMVEVESNIHTRTTSSDETFLRIDRDFHDMIAGLSLGMRSKNKLDTSSESTGAQDNFQVRLNFKFKPSSQKGVAPQIQRTANLYSAQHASAFERGG
jgi:hypothetical protein